MEHNIFLINIPSDCVFGGCERHLIEYFSNVDYSTNKITLVTTKDCFTKKLEDLKIPVSVLEFPFKFQGSFLTRFCQMYRLLNGLKPDSVIFMHNGFLQFRISCFLSAFFLTWGNIFSVEVLGAPEPSEKINKKYFGIIPSINFWWYQEMFPIVLRGWLFKRILVASMEVKRRLIRWYYYPEKKIVIEYHGTNVERFCPDQSVKWEMRKKLGIPQEDVVIVALVRFDKQKRIDRLIRGFEQIYRQQSNALLILVGDGPMRGELEGIVERHNIGGRVKFMGYQNDPTPYLQMSDIYVLSSDNEGFARVVMESMATGLVVVATNVPGVDEIIRDGDNGILVEASTGGVCDGLKKVFDMTENEKRAMSSSARQTILDHFDLKKQVAKELKVIGINGVTV